MSWSVKAIGKAPAVAQSIENQFTSQPACREPEEAIRQHVRAALVAALAAQQPNIALKVSASGSMSFDNGPVHNSFTVSVEPMYGFID